MKRKFESLISVVLATMLCCSMPVLAETADAGGTIESTETVAPAWDGKTVSTELQGKGTEEEPWLLSSAADFAYLNTRMTETNKTYFENQYFLVTADIDCNNNQLRIGTSSKSFGGILDGDGYSILNNKITGNNSPTGLFAYAKGATIKNLNVRASSIQNTFATATEKGTAGLLVGFLEGSTLSGCTIGTDCTVAASSYVGGLVGKATNSKVSACVNQATVSNSFFKPGTEYRINYCVGGILGYSLNGQNIIENCANFGTVQVNVEIAKDKESAYIFCAGGIVGYLGNKDAVTNCFNCADVSGSESFGQRISVGGIAGRVRATQHATIAPNGKSEMNMTNCCLLGGNLRVEGTKDKHVGLLVGFIQKNTTLHMESCAAVANGDLGICGGYAEVGNLDAHNCSTMTEEQVLEKMQTIRVEVAKERKISPEVIGYQETTPDENGTYGVRVLLGVDSLQYDAVQLLVTAEWTAADGTVQSRTFGETPETIVYSGILADGKRVDPLQCNTSYFAVCVAKDLPANAEITFTVQAFLTGIDETEPSALEAVEFVHQGVPPTEQQ